MSKPRSLRRQLFLARKAAEAVDKRGHSKDGDFYFARFEDVLAEASRQLEKRDILIVPQVVEERLSFGKSGFAIATVVMEFEVIDTKGDESLKLRWAGTGYDQPGDKAIYKAQTGCEKYFLAKLLGIPFGTDPEAEAPPVVSNDRQAQPEALALELDKIRQRLDRASHPSDLESIRLLLGALGITTDLPQNEADVDGFALDVSVDQLPVLEAELTRIEQDAAAFAPDEIPEPVHG